ncbi:MAG: response regulator [Deltaproteobacteria bacterium]|nr:response regulator [Deltaproteobacteria bacterium]
MTPVPTQSSDAVPELSCRPLKCMFLSFRKLKGEAALVKALADAGVTLPLSYLENESNWISFSLSQRILDALSEQSGVTDFPRRAGLTLATPEVLGFAYSALKAFGNVKLCYAQTLQRSTSFNKIGTFHIVELDANHLVLEYRSTLPEPNNRFSQFRIAQFQSFPSIWGLPLARATEERSPARGDDFWRYRFEWQNRPVFRDTLIGMVTGAASGFFLQNAEFLDLPMMIAAGSGALIGGALGALLDSRRELRARDSLLARQNADLVASVPSLTQRFEEISELNRTLEEKVDVRTSELASARDKLQAALAKAVALDRAKTVFFTNISHELRTPLTLILAPLETAMAEWQEAPKDIKGQLQLMHRNGVRLLDNINQLLDLSRLDAGRARLKIDEFDPGELLRSLVEASGGLARQRGIDLRFENTGGEVRRFQADRDKLEKIALNLIGNALKFSRKSEERPHPWVVVRCGIEGGRFVFHVSDSGIGIPQDQLGTIFERFSQVSGGDGREFGGSGIGLALAKELVEFHMGTISVSSIEGVGSTFTVRLPLSGEAIPDDRLDRRRARKDVIVDRRNEEERIKFQTVFRDPHEVDVAKPLPLPDRRSPPPPARTPPPPNSLETPAEVARLNGAVTPPLALSVAARADALGPDTTEILDAESQPISDPPPVMPGEDRPTLLLADDNLDMLGFLSRLLQREYRVLTAPDGEAALRVVRREHPALVVSDIMMPRMDGYQLLQQLRGNEDTAHIPVILLTAKNELGQKIHGLDEGADDYLSKPFNFLEFKARVRQLLRNRELERQLAEKNDYLAKLNFDLVLSKKEVFLQTIEAITFALEAKDTYTHGHSYRVSVLAASLARELKLSEVEIERVRLSALLHDVGKIGIREGILNKPGRLTGEEYAEIQAHPEIGGRILDGISDLKEVTRCVRYHHESWDGTGYPGKLTGKEIPLESRVIAVADTYDAMTSDRAYRKGLGHARAIHEIREYAGRQFDPEMARAFLRLYEERAPVFPSFPSAFSAWAVPGPR